MNATFNLASVQYEQKKYAEALVTVGQCALLSPSDPTVQELRERIEARPVEPEQARPEPLHGAPYVMRLSTNIDEHGKLIPADLTSKLLLSSGEILAMSREEAARVVGTKAWDHLHLQRLVQQAIAESEPPTKGFSVPFVSYRWGDPTHSAWVFRFVTDLEERGYEVVFDRNAEREAKPPSVPELIARMTRCNLFVPILSNLYTRRVLVSPYSSSPFDDGWVFDEWQIAALLGNMQRLGFAGIWVSGDDLPPPFRQSNVCDFRNPGRYTEEMDRMFPVRFVMVIGIRPDKTLRALTRVRRSESKKHVAAFQTLKEFEYIAIVEDPALGADPGSA